MLAFKVLTLPFEQRIICSSGMSSIDTGLLKLLVHTVPENSIVYIIGDCSFDERSRFAND